MIYGKFHVKITTVTPHVSSYTALLMERINRGSFPFLPPWCSLFRTDRIRITLNIFRFPTEISMPWIFWAELKLFLGAPRFIKYTLHYSCQGNLHRSVVSKVIVACVHCYRWLDLFHVLSYALQNCRWNSNPQSRYHITAYFWPPQILYILSQSHDRRMYQVTCLWLSAVHVL